jgi:hypothetical protein
MKSRDSAVGIATAYGMEGRGVGVRFLIGQEFSTLHAVQTGSGVGPPSLLFNGYRELFPRE